MNKQLCLYAVLIEIMSAVTFVYACPMHEKEKLTTTYETKTVPLPLTFQQLHPIAGTLSLKQAKKRKLLRYRALPCCQSSTTNISKKKTQKKSISTISSKEQTEGVSK